MFWRRKCSLVVLCCICISTEILSSETITPNKENETKEVKPEPNPQIQFEDWQSPLSEENTERHLVTMAVNPTPKIVEATKEVYPIYVGVALVLAKHLEEGVDQSKGDYHVGYTAFGGALSGEYEYHAFLFQGAFTFMRLFQMNVNGYSIDMRERTQWHLLFSANMFYSIYPSMALGVGLTHLTETSMYVNDTKVADSSFQHIFLDIAARYMPRLTDKMNLDIAAVVGLNMLPGRRHTYSIFDLVHARFQINVGVRYRVF
ncbi:MAG TPA: hypothetical protein PLY93_00580 [Turneriella sp.]|nr:hypothetical protein [Turneriella sp.]